ncbi:MAG: carbamoyltransferase HypF [Desulfurococcaceae archaeon]
MRRAKKIFFVGVVQGVGMRPFLKITADKLGVFGYVRNLGGGEVELHIEGEGEAVEKFIEEFLQNRPEVMYVEELKIMDTDPRGFDSFVIMESAASTTAISIVPPDFAVCENCLREVLEGDHRRRGYVFNSCSYCGPRFSVLYALPYDRENTSWRDYPMCVECRREYESPAVGGLRRYFYQGQSCKHCGPSLYLLNKNGDVIKVDDPVAEAAKLIEEGHIVAIKGVGGYHLAALATDDDVVATLRIRKKRPTQPFAIMALGVEIASRLVELTPRAVAILKSPQRPIVLLPKVEDSPVSPLVSPNLDKEGVFLPYSPLHFLLLSKTRDKFLIMTSCNTHGSPMCRDLDCVLKLGVADYVLDHTLKIVHRVDDSVVRFTNGEVVFLRRSRGYVPLWVKIPKRLKRPAVAFGADLQNTGAVAVEDKVVLTQHIGDLDNVETAEELEQELSWLMSTYRVRDSVYVCDVNPVYFSTKLCRKWAASTGDVFYIHHHYAHALTAAADWGEENCFISIVIDGVGYGPDGNAWGGEVLSICGEEFKRLAHLTYVPMPGGDAATYYPARMAISYLSRFLREEEVLTALRKTGLLKGLPHGEVEARVVFRQLNNSILTSSVGRFLDAVSALLGLVYYRSYEGEPAIVLESYARGGSDLGWRTEVKGGVVDSVVLFQKVYESLETGTRVRDIAYTVQYALGVALGEAACGVEDKYVYLSGGAGVNDYIARGILDTLKKCRKDLRLPRRVPLGDGGIALGQIYYLTYAIGI